jgi:hypothetical protein
VGWCGGNVCVRHASLLSVRSGHERTARRRAERDKPPHSAGLRSRERNKEPAVNARRKRCRSPDWRRDDFRPTLPRGSSSQTSRLPAQRSRAGIRTLGHEACASPTGSRFPSQMAQCVWRRSLPITAAGQLRIFTGFPHGLSVHDPDVVLGTFDRHKICVRSRKVNVISRFGAGASLGFRLRGSGSLPPCFCRCVERSFRRPILRCPDGQVSLFNGSFPAMSRAHRPAGVGRWTKPLAR